MPVRLSFKVKGKMSIPYIPLCSYVYLVLRVGFPSWLWLGLEHFNALNKD